MKKNAKKRLKKGYTVQPDGSFAKVPGADVRGAIVAHPPKGARISSGKMSNKKKAK